MLRNRETKLLEIKPVSNSIYMIIAPRCTPPSQQELVFEQMEGSEMVSELD